MAVNRPYAGAYRTTLEDNEDPSLDEDHSLPPEEQTYKKRYGDLRSHSDKLTKKVKELESQLNAAIKKEKVLPSTPQEIEMFARQYPDVFRAMQTVSLTTLKEEKEVIKQETASLKEDLNDLKREKGYQAILDAHPDFEEVNGSADFEEWAASQPKEIQDWLFESDDPRLCIRGLDLYKADRDARANVRARATPNTRKAASERVRPSSDTPTLTDTGGKRIWKTSEIAALKGAAFDKYEADIDTARKEGRIIVDSR